MAGLFGAIDIGATSGRVIAGKLTGGKLKIKEVHRFPNQAKTQAGKLRWDFDYLMREVRVGIRELGAYAERLNQDLMSVGIDTWAVDYGLVSDGQLLEDPNCYRDPVNQIGVDLVEQKLSFAELYESSGLQFLPFNSIYQLRRQAELDGDLLDKAESILLLPDLIGFFLTGKKATERTNASSTGLLNARTRQWDLEVAKRAGVPVEKFPELRDAGDVLGKLKGFAGPRFRETTVILVGSHDTASAVAAVPSTETNFAYLSSGTWSLLGTELQAPILTEESREANFSNELGVDGRVRFLKNLSGLWLLNECVRHWSESEGEVSLSALLVEAGSISPKSLFDVTHSDFVTPGDMPAKIAKVLGDSKKEIPKSKAETASAILHSLAFSFAQNLLKLETMTNRKFNTLHIIGGGVQNELLCQLTADYSGRKVIAGPIEATAIGNLLVQAKSAGEIGDSLESIRGAIIDSDFNLTTFLPK